MNNIKIYNPKGEVVFSHPPKGYYKKELMGDEYVIFSWNDVSIHNIPVGSYIKYKDIKFTLLEPYLPNMTNELQFKYELKFERFSWRKTPLYFIDGDIKESEFAIDGKPAIVLTHVLRSLKDELGEEYTLSIDESLTSSKSFNFQNESIVSALNKIADEWGTEWWLEGSVLHLSKCEKGERENLIIGDDIKPPSNSENDDYYTRFVIFGGSRNMAQRYEEGVNISTKTTLKLDKTKYPDSAISISDDIRFTKTLVFEDVYPRSFLEISDVRAEIVDYYGEDGQRVQVGAENGEPVYKTYPIYTIQFKDYTLDPSDVLNGLTPQVKFESGILEGRDFDVEIISSGLRIKYKDEAGIITPNYTLKPNVGDKVVLWNIKMPDKYIKDAQDELERVALKYINDLKLDNTQYTANTNKVKFDRFLDVGQRVRYVKLGYNKETDGTKELYTLDTRILSFQINLENNREQILVFGNNLVKGNIKELKEDVTNVNDNVALLGEIQNARDTILNVYGRTQQEFSKFVNQFSRMWTFKDIKGYEYAYTPYNVALKGSLVMYADVEGVATPSLFDAFPHDNKTIKRRADGVYYAVVGEGTLSEVIIKVNNKEYKSVNGCVSLPSYPSRLSHLTNDVGYLTKHQDLSEYAKISQVPTKVGQLDNDKGYVDSSIVNGYAREDWSNNRFALKSHKHNWSDITNTPTTLGGYGITDVYTKTQSNSRYLGVGANAVSATKLNSTRKIWGQIFDGTQDVEGDFVNGDGIMSFNKHWNFNKDIVSQGGITMYGYKGASLPSLFDSFPHDNVTIKRRADGVYYAVGGSSGISKVSVSVNDKEYLPDSNGKITIPNYPSRLSHLTNDVGYTTQQWVEGQKYAKVSQLPTRVSQLTNDSGYVTSSVVDGYATQSWSNGRFALKSHKHSWSDINNTPTTLGGYGITDSVNNFSLTSNDWDNIKDSGFYFSESGSIGTPSGAFSNQQLISVFNKSIDRGMQISSGRILDDKLFYRNFSGVWTSWREIAFTDSNVASASKLQNERKIWGQSFNGTQDVRGNASDIIDISMTGKLDGVTKIILKGGKEIYYDSARGGVVINDNLNINDLYVGGGVYNARALAFASSVKITDGFGDNILETIETSSGTTLSLMEESLMLNKDGALLNGKFYLNGCLIECIDGVFYLHGDVVSTGAITMISKK